MEHQEIKTLINSTKYDLETINCLHEFGRTEEILPILEKIINRIDISCANQKDIKDVVKDSFWEQQYDQGHTHREIFTKLIDASLRKDLDNKEETLLKQNLAFIGKLTQWVEENMVLLKETIKSPQQKFMEKAWGILSIALMVGLLIAVIFLILGTKTWGLRGEFYSGMNFENKISTGNAKVVNFFSIREMNMQMPLENSSARWHGILIIPKDGIYSFFLVVDDGGKLWIDNQALIDGWRDQNATESSQSIFLKKGLHAIRVEYYNHLGNAVLRLLWQFEGREKETIPLWNLRQDG